MISETQAQHIAQEWVDAWNARDLDAAMRHFADDIEFYSPKIAALFGNPDGRIDNKADLRAYFERGLSALPDLHFELLQVLRGVDSITIYYRRENGVRVAEMMRLDESGQVNMVRNHYSEAP